uniref:Kinase suppressor of ras 1b n=1 Tax=Sinocyclocheilus grahami TaxID=75366 RepID=A0A672M9I4_SINGR
MPLKPCQCRGMDTSVSGKVGNMVASDEEHLDASDGSNAGMDALHQCELIQNLIEISISSLKGLRTKCAASNDLTQHEIRALEVMFLPMCIFSRLISYSALSLSAYAMINTSSVFQAVPVKLSLDALLQMSSVQVEDTMKRLGSSSEECSRITAALSCLKTEPAHRDSTSVDPLSCSMRAHQSYSPSPTSWPPSSALPAPRSCVSVSALPSTDFPTIVHPQCDGLTDPFSSSPQLNRCTPRLLSAPPVTPPPRRYGKLKPPRTPPPPSHKLLNLLPNITLTRSKSQSQLANRIDDPTPKNSPLIMRKDIGLDVTHRFSTKSWLSQTCQVCKKNMMFGVKCKHCKVKCHNKCTKEAPKCRISFIRRTESVPSDINNQVDRPAESQQYGTLPKAINKKDHPPSLSHLDSSSNPSSTTSSTPSSPAPFGQSNPPNATPPPNPSPKGHVDSRFHFPALELNTLVIILLIQDEEQQGNDGQDQEGSDDESEGDEVDDLPNCRGYWKDHISRKASQTSVYLQEWDVPFEQLELGELIGKGRWGKVCRGRWHGEVAVRLLEIDGNNQEHLKLFKKEVMNYRQTRHENVVLFMGACMNPPHLAIITRFASLSSLNVVSFM